MTGGNTHVTPVGIVLGFGLVNGVFTLNRVIGLIRINHPQLFFEKGGDCHISTSFKMI